MTTRREALLLGVAILIVFVKNSSCLFSPTLESVAAKANLGLTLDLLRRTAEDGHNVVFSPFGISSTMALVSLAARGKTKDEIDKAMHFDVLNKKDRNAVHQVYHELTGTFTAINSGYNLSTATAFFGKSSIDVLPEFRQHAIKYYHGDFQPMRGHPETEINQWVSQHTNNMIPRLLPPGSVTPDTRLVLINAVYFKGSWVIPFSPKKTKNRDFYISDKQKVQVPTMFMFEELPFGYESSLKSNILELPYSGEALSMYIVLPTKRDGLKSLIRDITADKLHQSFKKLTTKRLEVKIPKFKLNLELPLSKLLKRLGVKQLFSNPDLSGLAPNAPPVSDIHHGAVIDVNEKGTEAAAATAVMMERAMPPEFNANHPFFFFVVHKPTDFILFAGAFSKP